MLKRLDRFFVSALAILVPALRSNINPCSAWKADELQLPNYPLAIRNLNVFRYTHVLHFIHPF